MKFKCRTRFDVTATGITGHFKSAKVPFTDRAGQPITDSTTWNRARNQQRNWETLTQLISLRAQIFEMSTPVKNKNFWEFDFAVETPAAFGSVDAPTQVLEQDAEGIPMLIDLDNFQRLDPFLITNGPKQNIWFDLIVINNTLENQDG